MSDLAEFLLARIAEDEATVRGWNPSRMLAECEAKRRIVELHNGYHECVGPLYGEPRATVLVAEGYVHENDPTLRLLALSYADHPDYREEWRP